MRCWVGIRHVPRVHGAGAGVTVPKVVEDRNLDCIKFQSDASLFGSRHSSQRPRGESGEIHLQPQTRAKFEALILAILLERVLSIRGMPPTASVSFPFRNGVRQRLGQTYTGRATNPDIWRREV
jgi:transposase-like protein